MASERIEIVRRANDAWNRGDLDAFLATAHPEVEWHTAIERLVEGEDRVRRGHAGVRDAWDTYHGDAWQKLRVEFDEVREVGDRVLALGRLVVTGRTTEITTESPMAQVIGFRDGKVAISWDYLSHEEALDAVGLASATRDDRPLFEEVNAAVERMDAERLVELTYPEVEWHSVLGSVGGGGVYRGHDGMRRYVADLADAWEDFAAEVDDALTVGGLLVLVGRIRYRGKGSGLESEAATGWVTRFRDGKLAYLRTFSDPERELERLGRRDV
jgi:ketosteroid isomerase-like protein